MRNVGDVLHREDLLRHGPKQVRVVQAVDLERPGIGAVGHVADEDDDRECCRAGPRPVPVSELVRPGPGTTHRTPGLPVARA